MQLCLYQAWTKKACFGVFVFFLNSKPLLLLPAGVGSGLRLGSDGSFFVLSFEHTMWCWKHPNISPRSTFCLFVPPPGFSVCLLQSTLDVCLPSSMSSVVPLTCVVHSWPLPLHLVKRCLCSFKKKSKRHQPEVKYKTQLLDYFLSWLFQPKHYSNILWKPSCLSHANWAKSTHNPFHLEV